MFKKKIILRFLAWFLLVSLLPLGVVVYINYGIAEKSLKKERLDSLDNTARKIAHNIESHVLGKITLLVTLAHSPTMVEAIERFKTTFKEGTDSPAYLAADKEFRPFLHYFQERTEHYDLFLISPDGDVVFTMVHEPDFGTNLKTGPYKDTELARVFNRAALLSEIEISDYRHYTPSHEPAAFYAAPILKDGELRGVLALQLSTEAIYAHTKDYTGLGQTGETVLAVKEGNEAIFVSPIRHDPEAAFNRKVTIGSSQGLPIQEAVQGKSGYGASVDYRGKEIFAVWKYLPTLRWGMVVKIDTDESLAPILALRNSSLVIALITVLPVWVLAFIVSRSVSRPVIKLTRIAEAIASGDLTRKIDVQSEDEIGKLAGSFETMTKNLQTTREENERQSWLKTGRAQLAEKMRGELDITELARDIISYLTPYMNAQIGAIYLAEEDGSLLNLVGSYAYNKRKNLSSQFTFGQGLVGQAALERQNILITNVPDDYIRVSSGLGEALPQNILVVPFLLDDKVKGVIELGSLDKFNDVQMDFLNLVTEQIAIAFSTTQANFRTKELLEETQTQAEELQTQQEELKASNEELEEQTQALKESEEKLKTQQEELQTTNEELEERSEALERERRNLRQKNVDLETAQKYIKEKAQQLEVTSKYKSEFLANMSHELRTPLNSQLILSRALSENKEGNLTEKQVEFARTVHSSGVELLALINDILDLSKVEAGMIALNIEDIRLGDIPTSIKQDIMPLVQEKGLKLDIKLAGGLPDTIRTDFQRLNQVLKNLLSNAIKFTDEGGLMVCIQRPQQGVGLSTAGLDPQKAIAIAVSDTGIGISEDKQKLIFEAFQQADGSTSRKYGGTGLGLSLSRELVHLLGGEIQLQSVEGKGSTFTLYLPETFSEKQETKPDQTVQEKVPVPLAEQATKTAPPAAPPNSIEGIQDDRKILKPSDKSILIIEDDSRFVKILLDLAHEKGFKALVAGDGETGLQFADYYKPSAIILDIFLPGIDGWAVMERLKDNPDTRNIPVHFISASEKCSEALKMGAIGCLSKPVSMEMLDGAFKNIENMISRRVKRLLIVEDDEGQKNSILELIDGMGVSSTVTSSGREAYECLTSEGFDSMVLNPWLADNSGFELLEKIRGDEYLSTLPVIIYTSEKLSPQEEERLREYGKNITIKEAKSPERLLDEVVLFLHVIEANLPEDKRNILRMIHDKEAIFRDKKILLVDDDARNVLCLIQHTRGKGHEDTGGEERKRRHCAPEQEPGCRPCIDGHHDA